MYVCVFFVFFFTRVFIYFLFKINPSDGIFILKLVFIYRLRPDFIPEILVTMKR